ncbi:MAG TPA: sulfatase-like hydrolase/transferase [Longimicrobium sp.]|nr:sulfatase-like hydrolase/transferase [Longimicrobium sp.]
MAWKDLPAKPNIVVIITDQMRWPQHWPEGWARQNLPSMDRLMRHGMTFTRAFCAACECSPSRGALVTSTYPQNNGVTTTGPNVNLPTSLPNLATVLARAGYQAAWRGKWHLFTNPDGPGNLDAYGFSGWDPPDSGTTLGTTLLGGGTPGTSARNGNDPRYAAGTGGAVDFLNGPLGDEPFLLVVSLVNPHDVHVYTQDPASVGYPFPPPVTEIDLPCSVDDPLTTKPIVQHLFRQKTPGMVGAFDPDRNVTPKGYVNFYAYLQKVVDEQVTAVLDALDANGLTDSTLVVRIGDHGEMGMAHGLREKMYNAYDEAIHVPMVFSNPLAFPEPVETDALASLVDVLPTLAAVAGTAAPEWIAGVDLTPVLAGTRPSVQDAVLYSYDDQAGLSDSVYATHIRAIRTERWMYAVYFSQSNPEVAPEFELYDVLADPPQMVNLLNPMAPDILPTWQALNTELLRQCARKLAFPPGGRLPETVDASLLPPLHRTFPLPDNIVTAPYSALK